jgi:hypothetical protein
MNFLLKHQDGERCGDTLQSIFENAKDPSKVIVGLVEQNAPADKFCLEEYCKRYGTCIYLHQAALHRMGTNLRNFNETV